MTETPYPSGHTVITVTASVPRPLQLRFPALPDPADASPRSTRPTRRYLDDVHGSARWRAAMTRRSVAAVAAELAVDSAGQPRARPVIVTAARSTASRARASACARSCGRTAGSASRRAATRATAARARSTSTGSPVHSCIFPAVRARRLRGHDDRGAGAAPAAGRAFLAAQGFQCGFCTAGMIMTAAALSPRAARGPAAGAQGQHLPLHRLRVDPRRHRSKATNDYPERTVPFASPGHDSFSLDRPFSPADHPFHPPARPFQPAPDRPAGARPGRTGRGRRPGPVHRRPGGRRGRRRRPGPAARAAAAPEAGPRRRTRTRGSGRSTRRRRCAYPASSRSSPTRTPRPRGSPAPGTTTRTTTPTTRWCSTAPSGSTASASPPSWPRPWRAAEAACALIAVDYEVLAGRHRPRLGAWPRARRCSTRISPPAAGRVTSAPRCTVRSGDAEAGFAAADVGVHGHLPDPAGAARRAGDPRDDRLARPGTARPRPGRGPPQRSRGGRPGYRAAGAADVDPGPVPHPR